MARKTRQLKAEGLQAIRQVTILQQQRYATAHRLMQTMWKHLLQDTAKRFKQWKNYSSNCSIRHMRAYTKLTKIVSIREIKNKKESLATLDYYSNTIIRVIEKIEKAYLIERHRLLKEILTLYYRDGIERLTTTSAPYKFTRWMTLKKNGYKYLGLLLRKFTKKRTVELFNWYESHTGVIRYACVMGRMVDRCLKQRG